MGSEIKLEYIPETGEILKSGHTGRHKWRNGLTFGPLDFQGYRRVRLYGKHLRVHRLAFTLQGISIPEGLEVDHINGVRDDNRWVNLRLVSRRGNTLNRKEHRAGVLPGTVYDKRLKKKPWYARIRIGDKRESLGYYATEQEAHEAYNQALKEIENGN